MGAWVWMDGWVDGLERGFVWMGGWERGFRRMDWWVDESVGAWVGG